MKIPSKLQQMHSVPLQIYVTLVIVVETWLQNSSKHTGRTIDKLNTNMYWKYELKRNVCSAPQKSRDHIPRLKTVGFKRIPIANFNILISSTSLSSSTISFSVNLLPRIKLDLLNVLYQARR